MYIILKRTLNEHLQALEHDFMCLDLSIVDWNEIQLRRLESLRLSIGCLRFIIEGFASSHAPLPAVIQDEVGSQIMTIADLAQLLLYRCADELSSEAAMHLQQFIATLKRVYDDINAYTTNTSLSA